MKKNVLQTYWLFSIIFNSFLEYNDLVNINLYCDHGVCHILLKIFTPKIFLISNEIMPQVNNKNSWVMVLANVPLDGAKASVPYNEKVQRYIINCFTYLLSRISPIDFHQYLNLLIPPNHYSQQITSLFRRVKVNRNAHCLARKINT